MGITRFRGRGNSGGVRAQKRNAPIFISQYSGSGSPDQDGQIFTAETPGALQTAKREPNPPTPKLPPPPPLKTNVILFRATENSSGVHKFHVSPWNISFIIDDFSMPHTSLGPIRVFGHHPANGGFTVIDFVISNIPYQPAGPVGFIALTVKRNGFTRFNSYNDLKPSGYEWVEGVALNQYTSDYYLDNSSNRYQIQSYSNPTLASLDLTIPNKIRVTGEIYKHRRVFNKSDPISRLGHIPRINEFIELNRGSTVFEGVVNEPALNHLFVSGDSPLYRNFLWGFSS